MATLSMTGFGRGAAAQGGFRAEAELSSVNRKQFDCAVALPAGLSELEERCRRLVHEGFTRGHAQLTVRVGAAGGLPVIDEAAVHARMAQLRALAEVAHVPSQITLADLARMPDLLAAAAAFPDPEAAWPAVEGAVRAAIASHRATSSGEGKYAFGAAATKCIPIFAQPIIRELPML